MKNVLILPAVVAVALAGSVRADVPPEDKSTITISDPLEVPGAVLEPGTYVVKLVDSQSDHNIVMFTSADERKVYALALATPHVAARDPKNATFVFYTSADGSNKALRTWYTSGNRYGNDFVYPPDRAAALQNATNAEVPSLTAEQTRELANRPAPAAVVSDAEPAPPAPAAVPAPVPPAPADSDNGAMTTADASSTLPKTASSTPLLLAAGALSLALACGLRVARHG